MKSPVIVMDIDGLYSTTVVPRTEILDSFKPYLEKGYKLYLIGDRPQVGLGQTTLEEIQAEVDWFMQDCFELPTEIVFNLTAENGIVFPWGGLSTLTRPATGFLLLLEQVAANYHGHVIDWEKSYIIYTDPKEVFHTEVIEPREMDITYWLNHEIKKS